MNNEKLIDQLSEDLQSKTIKMQPLKNSLGFLLIVGFSAMVIFSFFYGERSDLEQVLASEIYQFELSAMMLSAFFASLAAFYSSIPGREKVVITSTALAANSFIASIVFMFVGADKSMPLLEALFASVVDWHCFADIALFTAPMVAFGAFLLKQGAVTMPKLSAFSLTLSITSMLYIAVRFVCDNATVQHQTVTHLLPSLLAIAVVTALGYKLLRW